jgi:hypothetical protein
VDEPLLAEQAEHRGQVLRAEALAGLERQLERRALDVIEQDLRTMN